MERKSDDDFENDHEHHHIHVYNDNDNGDHAKILTLLKLILIMSRGVTTVTTKNSYSKMYKSISKNEENEFATVSRPILYKGLLR